jgi:hypothetical protein
MKIRPAIQAGSTEYAARNATGNRKAHFYRPPRRTFFTHCAFFSRIHIPGMGGLLGAHSLHKMAVFNCPSLAGFHCPLTQQVLSLSKSGIFLSVVPCLSKGTLVYSGEI